MNEYHALCSDGVGGQFVVTKIEADSEEEAFLLVDKEVPAGEVLEVALSFQLKGEISVPSVYPRLTLEQQRDL